MTSSLYGKKILVTREESQSKEFAEKVIEHGGKPIEAPLLKITCIENDTVQYFDAIDKYQWIFFTSANGVRCFFQLAEKYNLDLYKLQKIQIAAVGRKTDKALKAYGFSADFVPTIYNADIMSKEFINNFQADRPILLVQGTRSRDVLPEEFSRKRIAFDTMVVYETSFNEEAAGTLNDILQRRDLDFITFTSPSAAEAFMQTAKTKSDAICVCIGTTTKIRASELGFTSIISADEFTIEGMIECMSNYITAERMD